MLIKSYLQGWVVMISKIIPSSFRIFLGQWQIDKEGGSFGQLTLHMNISFMVFNNLMGDR